MQWSFLLAVTVSPGGSAPVSVVRTNANSMLALGKVRQQEAWSATSLLGVPARTLFSWLS